MQPQVQYSPDGTWFWDGARWRPVPRIARPSPPPAAEGMFWFFSAPEWAGAYVVMGLINLIPFVGNMTLLGWMLEGRDNLRRGWGLVPPAGFRYLGRGARVWVPQILYGLVFGAFVALGVGAVALLTVARAPWYGSLLAGLAVGAVTLALGLLLGFLFAAQVSLTDRCGIGIGINPLLVWRAAVADSRNSWRAFAASLLGGVFISLVALTIGLIIPFVASFVVPAQFLMAVPALASFDETRRLDPSLALPG